MAVAIGSFPIEQWAQEVRDLLRARGFESDVSYAGPRAYEVLVSDEDGDRAGEIMGSVGYLSCPVAGGAASMSGVLEWRDPEAEEEDELPEEIGKIAEDISEWLAHRIAAEAWSTPGDDISDKYEDVIAVAEFGSVIGVNGDIKGTYPRIPSGYKEVSEGGRVPTTESHVNVEEVVARTREDLRNKYPRLRIKEEEVVKILERGILKDWKDQVPVSVSGRVTIYAKDKVVREKEEIGQYVGKMVFPGGVAQKWYYNDDSKLVHKIHFEERRKAPIVVEYDVSDLDLDPENLTPSMLQDRLATRQHKIVRVEGISKGWVNNG